MELQALIVGEHVVVHEVLEGDDLPGLANAVYSDPAYYMEVAAANGLDSVRRLTPGAAIYMPPLEDPA